METLLASTTRCDMTMASTILFKLVNKRGLEFMRANFFSRLLEERNATEQTFVQNVRAFLDHHFAKGTRPKLVQDAIDAVVVAVTFDVNETVPVSRITEHDELYEQLKNLLGVDRITKAVLILKLRLRNQPISGNKDVLATRLLSFENNRSENNRSENPDAGPPVERPLARAFVSADAELDNDDSDEED